MNTKYATTININMFI